MRTRNAGKRFSLPAICPENDVSPEKVRRLLPRQKDKGGKTGNSSSFRASCPESNKPPQELRRISPRHKCKKGEKESMKILGSSMSAVSPENNESPGMIKCESSRQKSRGKTKSIRNDSICSSDKGYGGSSCEDVTECQRREEAIAANSEVPSAKKRKSEDTPPEESDSSSDDFLVPTQSLDLNSDFFKIEKKVVESDFSAVENNIFTGLNRLSESDDSDDLKDSKPVELERVICKQGIQKVKQTEGEHCSAGPVVQKVDDVSVFTLHSTRRGKKLLHAKEQKSSDKDSRQDYNQQDSVLVMSSVAKAEKGDCMQKNNKQDIARRKLHKVKVELSTPDVSKLDVSELLALGEGLDPKANPKLTRKIKRRNVLKKEIGSEEEGNSEWEEVDTSTFERQQIEHSIPSEGIAVTIKVPNMHQKKKKKRFDVAAYIKRRMNRVRRDIQVLMHKAHLLCFVAHGNYVNKTLNSEILMGMSLSLIPSKLCCPDKHIDLVYLQQIFRWFIETVELQEDLDNEEELLDSLQVQFQKKAARSRRHLVLMFVCVLRSLGINTRLVLSLQPLPLKPPPSEIISCTSKKSLSKGKKAKAQQLKKTQSGRKKPSLNTLEDVKRKRRGGVTKEGVGCVEAAEARKSNEKNIKERPLVTAKSESVTHSGGLLRTRKSVRKYLDDGDTTDSDEEVVGCEQESAKISKIVNTKSTTSKKTISHNAGNIVKNTNMDKESTIAYSSVSESDYSVEFKEKKNRKQKPALRVVSSDKAPMSDTKKKKDFSDLWSEVFLEYEKKWICVDVYHQQIDCVQQLSSRASQPVHYVLAWQDDGTIRDVTRRYCPKWHNVTRKFRVDDEWWRESLKPFIGKRTALDDQEDEDLDRQLHDRPLPTSLAEYKNHPLYVLKKDLLKFQAIYPPDAPTLGFIRGHAVYARECVHTLHSREKWLKQAKVVRLGETPYRIVTTLKWDRVNRKILKDVPLEIFGPWQVEDYIPPTAVDGKVPRNEYGNVELFKPSMLPGGTVHMQIPGLNSIARKLQIDCAPAITGFDFHSGSCHPVYDGFVICEEYKYVLAEAWQAEEEAADRRQEKKRLKRIYGNWRRLIKGLFIRERLKARYDFGPVKETAKTKTKKAKRFQVSKRKKTDDTDWEMQQCT